MAVTSDGHAPERQPSGPLADIQAGHDTALRQAQHDAPRRADNVDADLATLSFMIGG